MTGALPSPDLRALHGVLFVLLLGGALLMPSLSRWPWIWLAPLLIYALVTASIPRCANP